MPESTTSLPPAVPTNAVPLPRLVASAQSRAPGRHLARPKRGLSTLALAPVRPTLARRDGGRPHHLDALSGAASASR